MKFPTKIKPTSNYRTQETLALLKILALGERQIEDGKVQPASEVFRRLRAKYEQP